MVRGCAARATKDAIGDSVCLAWHDHDARALPLLLRVMCLWLCCADKLEGPTAHLAPPQLASFPGHRLALSLSNSGAQIDAAAACRALKVTNTWIDGADA